MRQGFESFFDKDLNGDSFIGAPPALDRDSNGLVDDVTNYALIKKVLTPHQTCLSSSPIHAGVFF